MSNGVFNLGWFSGTKKAGRVTCLFYALNFANSDLAKSIDICV